MKAIGYRTMGGGEVLTDIEPPRPAPGPRDLLVAVKAVSVNPVHFLNPGYDGRKARVPEVGYQNFYRVRTFGAQT